MRPAANVAQPVNSRIRSPAVATSKLLGRYDHSDSLMIKPSVVRSKVRLGLALNLSELAIASGYHRDQLGKMQLPLQSGKISLSDFKRVLRKRQDYREKLAVKAILNGAGLPSGRVKPSAAGSSGSANNGRRQVTADKFYAPSSKSAGKSASRQAPRFQLHSTA
jgi:hypothetical protein